MSDTVAVLGSGPAGLMAAHACSLLGMKVAIFSMGGPSELGGAQFLHRPIPGITEDPDGEVIYRVVGDAGTYQAKGYGVDGAQPSFVSFSNVVDGRTDSVWNLRTAYDRLVSIYYSDVNEQVIDREWVADNLNNFQLIISTIPRPSICKNVRVFDGPDQPGAHSFHSKRVRILNGRCFVPEGVVRNFGENVIIYNGRPDYTWYRSSDLWGVKSTEWGSEQATPYTGVDGGLVGAVKPLSTNCDCHSGEGNILLAGRYGAWDKSRLSDDGFYRTLAHFSALGGGAGSLDEVL